MRANQAAQTQATIGNFFDKLAATKQKQLDLEKAKATDYEGSAMRVLQAKAQGVEPDPNDLVRAKAYGEFQSMQNAIDPTTGNIYPKNRNIFETLGTAPSTATYTPQFPSVQPTWINPNAAMPPMPKQNSSYVNDLGGELVMPPMGDNYAEVSQMPPAQRDMARGVTAPMGASPKTMQKAEELNLEVNAAGAKKQAELDAEKQFNAPIAKQKILGSLAGMKNLNEDLDRAIKNTTGLTAGLGSLTSAIAGSPAADLKATLDTIQADAAFGALQQMRDNSPTGGALGAVSEKELALLMSAQAALAQSQSPAQLKYNLKRYKDIRNNAIDRVSKAYEEQYGESPDFNQAKESLKTPSGIGYKVVE